MGIHIRIPIKFPSSPIVLVDVHVSDFYFLVTCICRIRLISDPILNINRILLISSAEELLIALILFLCAIQEVFYKLLYQEKKQALVMNYIITIIPQTFLAIIISTWLVKKK